MKKIPTLFKRDFTLPHNPIINQYAVILPLNAVATRKYDGTAVLIKHGAAYIRYDAKQGQIPPPGFEPCEVERDPITGHWPGWIPADLSAKSNRWLVEALGYPRPPSESSRRPNSLPEDGTYELCGPKINGNPEHFTAHLLVRHGTTLLDHVPTGFDGLRKYLEPLDIEGIVWCVDDKPVAKIKKRDWGMTRG